MSSTPAARNRRQTLVSAVAIALACLFLASSIGKLADPHDATRFAAAFTPPIIYRAVLARVSVAAIAGVELLIAIALVTAPFRRAAVGLAIALLLAFTLAVGFAWAGGDLDSCGCFGLAGRIARLGATPQEAFFRNLGILAALAWLACQPVPTPRPTRGAMARGARRTAPGFTLIETLVVITIVSILITLMLPAMSEARIAARTARSQARCGQLLAALTMYGSDFDDTFPFFATRGNPLGPKVLFGHEMPGSYLGMQSKYYASLLVPNYLDSRHAFERPGTQQDIHDRGYPPQVVRADQRLTCTAFTSPQYWVGTRTPTEAIHFRPARWGELVFPSHKGLLLDQYAARFDRLRPEWVRVNTPVRREEMVVGLGDGSANILRWSDSLPYILARSKHGADEWPILTTRGGFAGVDN